MRRKTLIIPLFAAAAMLTIGHLAGAKQYQQVNAEVPNYQTYVPLRDGWIENTDGSAETNLDSAIRARNDRFWNGGSGWDSQERSFNALDEFVDTIHRANGGEGWRGAYRTPELVLHDNDHRYVSFLFGGGSGDIFVNIFQVSGAAGSGDRISGIRTAFDNTGYYNNKQGVNPAKLNAPISCNMVLKYYELPNEIQPGDHFLIYVRDGKTSDYGGFTFGDVRINQTLEDVAKTFSAHKTQMKLNEFMSDWTENANEYVLNYYATDSYYATVRTAEAALADANDGFEVNDRLTKWAYDADYSIHENNELAVINYDKIYSDKEYKWGAYFNDNDGLMPINKTGNLFLTGEPEGIEGDNPPRCGVPESSKYRLISPEFTLSGTGLISAKIGGHYTALQLLDNNLNVLLTTGNTNPSFVDDDITNIAQSGARQCTMVRTYLDCKEYLGDRVHVALADTQTGGGWNLAYFDEIVTKYDSLPGLKIDYFTQTSSKSANEYNGYVLDKYVYDGEKEYNASFKEAYDFLQTYYSTLRTSANKFDYAYASSEAKSAIALAYSSLNDGAKTIVDASDDLEVVQKDNNFNTNWWFNTFVNPSNHISVVVPDELSTVVRTVSFNANGGEGTITDVLKLNGKTYNLPECTFTAPEGYEFAGWKVDGAGETLDPGDEITVSADTSLVAQWSILKFSVTYNANSGSGDDHVVGNVEYGTEYELLALNDTGITAPNGKKFVEWNTSADGNGTSKQPGATYSITEGITFYAIWVDTAVTKIKEETTLSALRFYYQDNNLFRDVALRFGGFISQDLWDELETETTILGYGVIVSTSSSIQTRYEAALGETVDEKLDNLCDNVTTKKVSVSGNTPATANDDQENYMGVTGDYYVWQVRVNIGDKFTTNYSSVAYIKTSDGIIFLQEVTCSAKSLATSTLPKIGGSDPIRVPFQTMSNWEAA